jgi:hypothetical protein
MEQSLEAAAVRRAPSPSGLSPRILHWSTVTRNLEPLRRALAQRGLTPASFVPEASGGRLEEASIRPATLVEHARLETVAVGRAEIWTGPLAYLDGIQRSAVVGYHGSSPVLAGEIAAAVRERHDRRLRTVTQRSRHLILARPGALVAVGDGLLDREPVPLPDDEAPHPVRDLLNAARALDRERGALELAVGDDYRSRSKGWLIVDGSLAESPRWAQDPHLVAVAKSHSILPFEGEDLERYLRLPMGHRSSVYAPVTRSLAPVLAWGLRVWPWEGKDLLHGLVRVEVAPANGTTELANAISRWILAERAPVSAPDQRWDRLLYGVYSVEQYLKART